MHRRVPYKSLISCSCTLFCIDEEPGCVFSPYDLLTSHYVSILNRTKTITRPEISDIPAVSFVISDTTQLTPSFPIRFLCFFWAGTASPFENHEVCILKLNVNSESNYKSKSRRSRAVLRMTLKVKGRSIDLQVLGVAR
jgi:hypothetical protein